jgi:hypothetical protein
MYKQSTNCVVKAQPSSVNPKFVPTTFGGTEANKITVTAQSQEPVLLKYLFISAGATGVVDDLKIGNQSLNCSDSSIDLALFDPYTQRKPMIGVAVDGNIQLSIDVKTDADTGVTAGFSCEAIEGAPSMNEQGDAIDKFFGLGSVSVEAGGVAELSAQCLRDAFLKSLVLSSHDEVNKNKVVITDISIKGRSIFSGQSGAGLGIDVLSDQTQDFALMINTAISTNERVVVKLANTHTAAIIVGGGAYCE